MNPEGEVRLLMEVFLRVVRFRMVEVNVLKRVEPKIRRKMRVKMLSLAEISIWRGRHSARTKAMPEEIPESSGCGRWNARANVMRNMPPNRGPSPNRSEIRNPEAASEL